MFYITTVNSSDAKKTGLIQLRL